MITINVLEVVLYSQLALSLALFFAIQLLVLAAREKIERVADWLIYKGTWLGVASQVVSMTLVGAVVLYSETDPVMVAHCVLLTLLNAAWFVLLRLSFEFADHICVRQESK